MVDVQPYLQKIVEQFDNPKVQTSLKGFTRTFVQVHGYPRGLAAPDGGW